jgi:hypothetical protein
MVQPVEDAVTIAFSVTGVWGLGRVAVGCGLRLLAGRAAATAIRTVPENLAERLTLEEAKAGAGKIVLTP